MQHLKFIHKLHSILSRPELQDWIYWSKEDSSIFVVKPYDPKFSSEVLKRYFKHGNVSSFVRQLHMYGFHKISANHNKDNESIVNKTDIKWSFTHPSGYFHKNAYSLTLNNIQRKRTGLGKDGKRKNILSPVSVNFINPTGSQPITNGGSLNVSTLRHHVVPPNARNANSYMMNSNRSLDFQEIQQPIVARTSNGNGYPNQEEGVVLTGAQSQSLAPVYVVDSYATVSHPNELSIVGRGNMQTEMNEGVPVSYHRQQAQASYSVLSNGQVVSYSSNGQVEQPTATYQHYYQPTKFSIGGQKTQQDVQRQQTQLQQQQLQKTNVTSSHPQFPIYEKDGPSQRHVASVQPLVGYSSNSDFREHDKSLDASANRRGSMSIPDMNNPKIERLSESPHILYQIPKALPHLPINGNTNERYTTAALPYSSSNETLRTTVPSTQAAITAMEEYRMVPEVNGSKFKNIDTNMEIILKGIRKISDQFNLLTPKRDHHYDPTKNVEVEDATEKNVAPKLHTEFPTNSIPMRNTKINRLDSFLKDMKAVTDQYPDLMK
ncbi:hypothetical protein C6P45_004433 [Maudiozyma exigua]|uniref:HSF-type DNA-binding domain-containing protein n=1 Tax=Maudiozyma exigua TaxID=34358 RepID=A0A9P7BBF4_MAUEX|nr:hypothetical protein C6P45_004433 [Kazachstania exigua]